VVLRAAFLLLALCLAACGTIPTPAPAPVPAPAPPLEQPTFTQLGVASWYGAGHQGHPTATGEPFDMNKLTAAHRTLPLNTIVRVTNVATRKTIKLKVNDRGPFTRGRIIDLSARAARELGISDDGLVQVRIEVFDSDQPRSGQAKDPALP
jgi:rare lipoprotein A